MKFRCLLVVSLLGAITATPAFAQWPGPTGTERPERPYRGIFGSGTSEAEQVLSLNGSVSSGYDSNLTAAAAESGVGIGTVPRRSVGGLYQMLNGGLSYSRTTDRVTVGASASSSLRHSRHLADSWMESYSGSVGSTFSLSDDTDIDGSVGLTYQPWLGFAPFLPTTELPVGQLPVPDHDFSTTGSGYHSYSASLGFFHQLSRDSSITAAYSRQNTRGSSRQIDGFATQFASARFTRRLTRDLSLRLGYRLTQTDYQTGDAEYYGHSLDSGVDYSRSLSLTRRTEFTFSTGATATREGTILRFDVIGSATLTRELGRTWTAVILYNRNVGYSPSVRAPFLYDAVSAGIDGMLSRRVRLHSEIGINRGAVGFVGSTDTDNHYLTTTASSGFSVALHRHLALGADYNYYQYGFDNAELLVPGLAPEMNRHSFSISLSAWAPIFQRGRRTDATR